MSLNYVDGSDIEHSRTQLDAKGWCEFTIRP